MLTNYDAKSVADVMGIAFLADPDSGPMAAADVRAFVIDLDHVPVRIVEPRPKGMFGDFEKTKDGTHRNFVARTARMRPPSPVLIEKAVEKGLPRRVLRRVAERIAGGDKAKISSLEWGIVPKTTLERRTEQLSPPESERTERVARLFVHARRALGSEAEAREFLTTPHPQLDGRTPIGATNTDLGTRRAEQILNALEYGLAL